MFRQSLNLRTSIIRKTPVIFPLREEQIVRLYQNSSINWKKIEGGKQECPDEKSGRGFYYTLGALVIGTGAVVAYAKHDEDFRDLLRKNVPGSDEFISLVTFEESSPVDMFLRWIAETAYVVSDAVYGMITGTASKPGLPPCDEKQAPYVPPKSAFASIKPKDEKGEEQRSLFVKDEDAVEIVEKAKKKGEKVVSDVKTLLRPENLKQLEEQINKAATAAIAYYTDAVCALRDLAEEIFMLVESSIESVDPHVWRKIKAKTEEREKLVKAAEASVQELKSVINQLQQFLKDPTFPGTEEHKENAERNIRSILKSVDDAQQVFQDEKTKMSVSEKYWSRVLEARKHFSEELGILFPNLKLNSKQMKFAEGEIDLFILYAYQNILYYQKELSKLEILTQRRLQEALLQSKLGDPQAIDAIIEQELEKEKRNIGLEFQKRMLSLKTDCEKEMRIQMKRQAEAHSDHLREIVDMKEKEMERNMQRAVDEQLEREKIKFKQEVAAMVARLRGIDDIMKCRVRADARVRASQALWSACQALDSALRRDTGPLPPADAIRPLENEISAIVKSAARDDELVDIVVSSIPREARTRGVYPEPVLRERFLGVERVAKRVALLPDGGASLPVMLLSYLQSFLVLSPANPIPSYELAGEPVEVGKFNTFEILQRARYWVDRGDFFQALKYMNLLDGAAYVVAKDWCNEIRIFLETQQAAAVLMAHASATGMAYS